MRPVTARRHVQNAIDHWVKTEDNHKLKRCVPILEQLWKKASKQENYYDSYYDYQDVESIRNNMNYISDRWRCAGRIKWLLEGVKNNLI